MGYLTSMDTELRERSLPELLKHLSAAIRRLAKLEVQAAQSESQAKVHLLPAFSVVLMMAGAAGAVALGASATFLILVLSLAMPAWLAALIVAAGSGILALVLAFLAAAMRQKLPSLVPLVTIDGLNEAREEVAGTIDAIGYRADIKHRAQEKVADVVQTVLGSVCDALDHAIDRVTKVGAKN